MNNLTQYIQNQRLFMLESLTQTVNYLKASMRLHPMDFADQDGVISVDIRLCVDGHERPRDWVFRTGSADFDPVHSEFCGASTIHLDTDPKELLEDLIEQLFEQIELGV